MFTEEELLPISALQHLAFCERQWALIHIEGIWQENRLTAEGTLAHERAHQEETETRRDVRITHGLRLRSLRLGLIGIADVVEFHKVAESTGIPLNGIHGIWQPFIIEYKHGRPKIGPEDEVQLCAQAMCLEEMLGISLSSAAFYYGQPRRRCEVILNQDLRQQTEMFSAQLHKLTLQGKTPPAEYTPKCRSCSLYDTCLPQTTGIKTSISGYLQKMINDSLAAE